MTSSVKRTPPVLTPCYINSTPTHFKSRLKLACGTSCHHVNHIQTMWSLVVSTDHEDLHRYSSHLKNSFILTTEWEKPFSMLNLPLQSKSPVCCTGFSWRLVLKLSWNCSRLVPPPFVPWTLVPVCKTSSSRYHGLQRPGWGTQLEPL